MAEVETEKPRWQDRTLKAAGYSYLVGDAAMIAAGKARGSNATISGAATWLAGGIFAARYGNPDHEQQLRIQMGKLEEHLAKQGYTIPDDARGQSDLLANRGMWGKIEQYLYEHPSEALNAMYAVGAGMLLRDGAKELSSGSKRLLPEAMKLEKLHAVSSNFWIGALVMAGALSGLLIKEDPQAQEKAKDGNILEKAAAWVKEKPLRVSSTFYTLNNGFLALRAYQDFGMRNVEFAEKALKPHHFSIPQLGAYLFGNTMLLLSSRDQMAQQFSAQDLGRMEEAAAAIITAQPPVQQKQMLEDIAGYLAQQKGVGTSAVQLTQEITARMATMQQPVAQR